MRRSLALLSACALLACATLARAADATPAVDLVARFVIGVTDQSSLAGPDGGSVGTVTRIGSGVYDLALKGQATLEFRVTEKTGCVFDIGFSQGGTLSGGIEVDANKLKSVTYEKVGSNDNLTSYQITLVGADGIVQAIGEDGKLSETDPGSTLTTSLSADDMQAAAAEFQSTYCKPAV
jgi:hypothetical protein